MLKASESPNSNELGLFAFFVSPISESLEIFGS